MVQEEERVRGTRGRRGAGWQRVVLWVLFAVLGTACLWMWWVMGRIQEAMDRRQAAPTVLEKTEGKP